MKTQYQQEGLLSIPSVNTTRLCPHGVKGWTFDPQSRLWVHPDPKCWLPKHRIAQEENVPKIVSTDRPRNAATFSPVKAEATGNGWGTLTEAPPRPDEDWNPKPPWWESYAWPREPVMAVVDPGDLSCGVAFFRQDEELEPGAEVIKTLEMGPRDFEDMLAWLIIAGRVHTVVYERFRLYADKSVEQTGSEFETSQLIGVIRWMVRKQNEHAELHVRWVHTNKKLTCEEGGGCSPGRLPRPVKLVGQMADIKKPARGVLRFKQIKSWSMLHRKQIHAGRKLCEKDRCHAVDAELHGWYWLLKGHASNIEERPKVDERHIQAMEYDGANTQEEDA